LFVILPLAGTLTAFYVWTLSSLNVTIKDLVDRKQKTKALMYRKLSWCILGSILVIFAFFFVNSFAFAGSSEADFVPSHWQTRWFVLDGWLNLVYLFDIAFVAYLWRPTANNRRFAMSDEVSVLPLFRKRFPEILADESETSWPKMTTASRSEVLQTHLMMMMKNKRGKITSAKSPRLEGLQHRLRTPLIWHQRGSRPQHQPCRTTAEHRRTHRDRGSHWTERLFLLLGTME
jgi:hypothetical protein